MQMVSMVRLAALWLALSALGCSGGGLSQEDATLRCDQLKSVDQCIDAKALDACRSCYEECGDKCKQVITCPAQFSCPAE